MILSFSVQCAVDIQLYSNCTSAGRYSADIDRMQRSIGLLCLSLLTILTLVLTQSENSCFTPIGELGDCVPYQQCQFVLDVQTIYKNKIPSIIQNQIKQMWCNFEEKAFHLCCPKAQVISSQTTNLVRSRESTNYSRRIDQHGLALLHSVKDCGKISIRQYPLIVTRLRGGNDTDLNEYPWMVLLKYETTGRPFLCGGTLITDRFVLTAAHCVVGTEKLIAVRMGEFNLDTEEDCEYVDGQRNCLPPYEEYGIEDIRSHPQYDHIDNDIALIKLNRKVTFKEHIKPICLPIESNSQNIPNDQLFSVTGWGLMGMDNRATVVLRKAIVKRKELDVCRNFYTNAPVTQNHICAVGDNEIQTCQGDSGGPVFKDTLRYVHYNIESHGALRSGKNDNQHGLFSSVFDILPWITQNLY